MDKGITISRSPDVQWKLIEGQAVLLNLHDGVMLRLDRVGTKIWTELERTRSMDDLVRMLTDHYEVPRERAEKDIKDFLKQLEKDETIVIERNG